MTKEQQQTIERLRNMGLGYRKIGIALGLPRDKVRNYCKVNGLDGYAKRASKPENPKDFLSQSIQKTLFIEKRKIIENCLFGVDINPNAVAICQLRLWIELLKNAYYENGVMETLPNIDINIKCGNSLIHKIQFQVGQSIGTKDAGFSKRDQALIKEYKATVKKYHSTSDKHEKHELKSIVTKIKDNLHTVCQQLVMKAKGNQLFLTYDINYTLDIYKDAFEWAIEFPEIISEKGTFLGFDCIIGNPPYIRVQEMSHADIDYYKNNYSTAWKRIDISTMFIELSYKLITQNSYASFIIPVLDNRIWETN